MSDVNSTRRYTSPLRAESARRTRAAVVSAAMELFLEQGYAATTIDQIAARAGVSRPTVFAVGSKAELLRRGRGIAIMGEDDPALRADRPSSREFADTSDPEQVLRRYARMSAAIAGRLAPLHQVLGQASAADPDLGELWRVSEQERLDVARRVVGILVAKGPLKPGLSPDAAADILWLLMAPDQFQRLVVERGWTVEQFGQWYADTMVRLLLP